MTCLLTIETSTQICSLSLSINGKSIMNKICTKKKSHASLLGAFTLEAVNYVRKNNYTINAVAVSAGPGSYTGLRIGTSEAKGLCYGFDIPLITIPTLKIMAFQAIHNLSLSFPNSIYCPIIDAERMEVFTVLYDANLNEICPLKVDTIDENSYKEFLKKRTIIFFGNGLNKCTNLIKSPNAIFIKDIYPTAKTMIYLAETAFAKKEFTDIAYFEPFYLKEYQTTVT
ncbi:tRNA (adenosine(37)-N6)-threonylcarbamoyltransferase complex dimerization subunit type 1 TsaB [Candidatus Azobacteroides pseudotrichonymphae]|uniref:M22 family peptidase n=1 Tax=Azobacteroides pseudotrichonymphae genomovar. CFP2 TaxID=511995 RepID=B6YS48_AZOPC|nr:tRNA (adenosine(37)-N6)-threonylcarbamoyltransferase complex dimerization subunit type 1 TsaB [Candidatus Azobacteroides pseudotrichonymphae]BAG84020.1 M22 family peptidase [Candidatus Azobacteroides pseudotrichonymphae genomovar. CFP2]